MTEIASKMQYLFCFGKQTSKSGLGYNLKTCTQMISLLGVIMSIPIMLVMLSMNWKEYKEVPTIFVVYEICGNFSPLLMLIGSTNLSFDLCYIGYILHSIYTYGLIIFSVFIGLFWGIVILPAIIINPPFIIFYFLYFIFWILYVSILLYFNRIYYSFTRHLGLGNIRRCIHVPQSKVIILNKDFPNIVNVEPTILIAENQ